MDGRAWLDDMLLTLRKTRALGERALAQLPPEALHVQLGADENTLGLIMKHVAGNMRSRWTDFLTRDGEKPDRARDTEFEHAAADTPAALRARWDAGWDLCLSTIGALSPADLQRVVTIRGQPHTVMQAVHRQVSHYSYHVGQMVLLARHLAGPAWVSLSIPKGRSADVEVARDGRPYRA